MEIILIAAMAKNRVIGVDNKLPWHIPEELRLFKKTTIGHPMIMGRKTFESFPAPLPGRRHIVLSRNREYSPEGAERADSLAEALQMCEAVPKVFVIGGAQIFTLALPFATGIRLTQLERDVDGDVVFPDFEREFVETGRMRYADGSEPFAVVSYSRKS